MRLPLVWVACGWAAGIALAAVLGVGPTAPLLVAAGALGGACATRGARPCLVVLAALAGGMLAHAAHPDMRGAGGAARVDVTLEGQVARSLRGGVVLSELRAGGATQLPERLRVRDAGGEPAVEADLLPDSLARAGEGARLRLRARVRPPQPLRNPGAPPGAHLSRGAGGVGRLVHPALWIERDTGASPQRALRRVRERMARRLSARGEGGALLAALAVGRREGLDPELRRAISAAGIGHLLAVSGLHLALVAGGVFAVGGRLLGSSAWLAARLDTRRLALACAWGAASGYALLAGAAPPVQRAWVCLSVPALALLAGRAGPRRGALAAAALLVLLRDPLALFAPGAQLSFAAAAALGRDLGRGADAGAVASLLRASATAMLATAPLVALHFAATPPAALLANLAAVPWTACVLLPTALLAAGVAGFAADGEPLLTGAAALGELSLAAVASLAALSGGPARPPPGVGAILLSIPLALYALQRPETLARIVGCLGVTGLLAFAPAAAWWPAAPRLVVLDVGQGDAVLVQGTRAAVLVDAGVSRPDGPDRGRDVVLPALRALGVRRLDRVVVTHADADHRGGIPAVLSALPVDRLWLPRGAAQEPLFAPLRGLARRRRIPVEERGAGDEAEHIGDLRLRPLWPPPRASGSSNDRSLVLLVEREGGRRVLLPGDLETAGERALLARGAALGAEVLLLGHHGSLTSSSPAFLDAVAPRVVLVSAPCLGRFAMPHPEVLARLRGRGLPLFWTGRDGALRVPLVGPLEVRGTGARRRHCGPPSDPS